MISQKRGESRVIYIYGCILPGKKYDIFRSDKEVNLYIDFKKSYGLGVKGDKCIPVNYCLSLLSIGHKRDVTLYSHFPYRIICFYLKRNWIPIFSGDYVSYIIKEG